VPAVDNLKTADLVVRGGVIRPFDFDDSCWASMAVRNGAVIAMSSDADGLDELVGLATRTIEASGQTVLPGCFDTRNHMLHTALDADAVQLAGCSTIAELVDAVRSAAASTPPGAWIVPFKGWHESNLVAERLPTRHELDAAGSEHPIALRRGGHAMVANTVTLDHASLNEETADPPGDTLEPERAGVLIERLAFAAISALLPPVDRDEWARRLRDQCSVSVHDTGWLSVRSDVMIRLDPGLGFDGMRAELERWDARTNLGDAKLRPHGVKIFLDGGIEGAAMIEDYDNQPGHSGHLFLTTDQIVELGEFVSSNSASLSLSSTHCRGFSGRTWSRTGLTGAPTNHFSFANRPRPERWTPREATATLHPSIRCFRSGAGAQEVPHLGVFVAKIMGSTAGRPSGSTPWPARIFSEIYTGEHLQWGSTLTACSSTPIRCRVMSATSPTSDPRSLPSGDESFIERRTSQTD